MENRRIVQNGFDLVRNSSSTPIKQAKMSSIIINSFYRALTSIEENEGIKNLSVQQLTKLLVDILYPEDGVLVWENEDTLKIRRTPAVQEVTVPVIPAAAEVKEIQVKEVKPKLTKEEKAAAKVAKDAAKAVKDAAKAAKDAAKEAKTKAPEPVVAAPEPVVAAPEPEAPKAKETKAKAAKTKAPEPVVAAPEPVVAVPEPEAPKAKETKPKAAKEPKEPKAKFVGNLEKLTPTQDKLLKKTATESNVEIATDSKTKFITFVNAMDNKDFNGKKLEEHMKAFFAPKTVVEKDADCLSADYKGKTYWVDINNADVYETEIQEDGSEIDKKVGTVGLAYFADMKMPVE
jgi:translation initiation factor 1 (eIF-1/SUI1)